MSDDKFILKFSGYSVWLNLEVLSFPLFFLNLLLKLLGFLFLLTQTNFNKVAFVPIAKTSTKGRGINVVISP